MAQFSLRPLELSELCPRLCSYFRWFITEGKCDLVDTLVTELDNEVSSHTWYDVLGRRVRLREHDLCELVKMLEGIAETNFKNYYSRELQARLFLLTTTSYGDDHERCVNNEDCDKFFSNTSVLEHIAKHTSSVPVAHRACVWRVWDWARPPNARYHTCESCKCKVIWWWLYELRGTHAIWVAA